MNVYSMQTDAEGMWTDADNCGQFAKMQTVADNCSRMRTKPDVDMMRTRADSLHTCRPLQTNADICGGLRTNADKCRRKIFDTKR